MYTVASSIVSFPTCFPSRSVGWSLSTCREPCSSIRTTSSWEILARQGGSFGFAADEAERVIGMRISSVIADSPMEIELKGGYIREGHATKAF